MYSTLAATVTVTKADTLTEGGRGVKAVRVQYMCRHSYCDLRGYYDRGG